MNCTDVIAAKMILDFSLTGPFLSFHQTTPQLPMGKCRPHDWWPKLGQFLPVVGFRMSRQYRLSAALPDHPNPAWHRLKNVEHVELRQKNLFIIVNQVQRNKILCSDAGN